MEEATRFFHRFEGLSRAHGRYILNGKKSGKGKLQGSAHTVREAPTVALWEKHLSGEKGIGIVPIRDDATAVFGAIDIDQYEGFDLNALSKELVRLELPLILVRSKSGGAHLYVFTSEPVPAELVRGKLMEWAVMLGHSGVEVFPKQVRLAGESDYGNWINMPYFDAKKPMSYAIYDGEKKSSGEFLDLADLMQVDEETLRAKKVAAPVGFEADWEEAPPCLVTLAKRGFQEGSRNNALFNIGVYLRKRYEDDFEAHVDAYNNRYLTPPLGHKEVVQVVKSLKRKTYEYKCNDLPIVQVCNRQICLTKKCGIGTSDGDPGVVFGSLLKIQTDPPTWIWDVNGARIELTTNELKDQGRFHTRCIDELNIWPILIKNKDWSALIRDKLMNVETMEVPADATPEGQMWVHLYNYITGRAQARTRDELAQNKPWANEGRIYFSSVALQQYLEQQRFRVSGPRQLWNWLRKRGATHHFFNIKDRGINCWSIPSVQSQTQDYYVPRIDDFEDEPAESPNGKEPL